MQIAVFGRELTGREDVLPGYAIRMLAKSANVVPSSTPEHFVRGTVYEIQKEELAAADKYEQHIKYHTGFLSCSGPAIALGYTYGLEHESSLNPKLD